MERFRDKAVRAHARTKPKEKVYVSSFSPGPLGRLEKFFGYRFPFAGVIALGELDIKSGNSKDLTLEVEVEGLNGYTGSKVFKVKEGSNQVERLAVNKGDKIITSLNWPEEEVGVEVKDVFLSFTLIGEPKDG